MATLKIGDTEFLIDEEDVDRVSCHKWCVFDNGRGHIYAQTSIYLGRVNGKRKVRTIRLHRFLLGLEHGDKRIADHENGNTLDNRRSVNLRIATYAGNASNRRLKRGGAVKTKDGFIARVTKNGQGTYLGFFKTEGEAASAYQEAAAKIHGKFVRQLRT